MAMKVLVEMEIEVVMVWIQVEMETEVMVDQEMKDGWERKVQVEMEPQQVMEVLLAEHVVGVGKNLDELVHFENEVHHLLFLLPVWAASYSLILSLWFPKCPLDYSVWT